MLFRSGVAGQVQRDKACYLRYAGEYPYIDLLDINDGAGGAFIYTCGSLSH